MTNVILWVLSRGAAEDLHQILSLLLQVGEIGPREEQLLKLCDGGTFDLNVRITPGDAPFDLLLPEGPPE